MNEYLAAPAAVDIDLELLAAPGPEWRRMHERDGEVWVNEKDGRLIVIPGDRAVPPSQWGLLS